MRQFKADMEEEALAIAEQEEELLRVARKQGRQTEKLLAKLDTGAARLAGTGKAAAGQAARSGGSSSGGSSPLSSLTAALPEGSALRTMAEKAGQRLLSDRFMFDDIVLAMEKRGRQELEQGRAEKEEGSARLLYAADRLKKGAALMLPNRPDGRLSFREYLKRVEADLNHELFGELPASSGEGETQAAAGTGGAEGALLPAGQTAVAVAGGRKTASPAPLSLFDSDGEIGG